MSLVTQLRDGMLADWADATLPGAGPLIAEVQAVAHGPGPVRPASRDLDPGHWATIGGAFGQRMAFLTSLEPPYTAYLGAATAGLLGADALDDVTSRWPTHRSVTSRASEMRPTATGWTDLATNRWDLPAGVEGTNDQAITEFTRWLVKFLTDHALPGTIADTRANEKELVCACWVLNAWDSVYRGGALPQMLREAHTGLEGGRFYADEDHWRIIIHGLVDTANYSPTSSQWSVTNRTITGAPDELVALTARLKTSGALATIRALAGNPPAGHKLGIAQPTFVTRWAEGDILVGQTLLDVKTVISLRDRDRIERWLRQILCYAWLDHDDRYQIRDVGLYLARHGALLTWPLEELAARMLGPGTTTAQIAQERADFQRYAYEAMGWEGADLDSAPGLGRRTA